MGKMSSSKKTDPKAQASQPMRAMLSKGSGVAPAALPMEGDGTPSMAEKIRELEALVAYQAEVIAQLQATAAACPVTGLANRRALENELAKSLSNAKRHDRKHGLVLLKLEGFDALRATLEPETVHAVLRHVAGLVRQNIRPTDIAAHLEDHTFVVILNELKVIENADMRAAQLVQVLEATPYVGPRRSVGVMPMAETRLVTADDTVTALLRPFSARASVTRHG